MSRHHDTIAALATPAGTAALAILRVSGPDTQRIAAEICGAPPPPRRAVHRDYRDRHGALIDDVVLTFFAGPHSYTAEDAAEITCHGNPLIAQKILEDLMGRGCRAAEPGEFTQRAFINGRLDLSQAEAVMDVIHARSERALAAAHEQLRGGLGRRMQALTDALVRQLAIVEAYIDFPEEDLPEQNRAALRQEIERLERETARLLATSHYGDILRDGLKVVIVGEPNVGKSSLLNRLVGRERALVSPEPGTTRDFIEERIMIGAHGVRLIDTAGLNPHPAPLERLGIEKTRERMAEADVVLLVGDAMRPETLALPIEPGVSPECIIVSVVNKSDLCDISAKFSGDPLLVSARTGEGIETLQNALVTAAEQLQRAVGEDRIAINARHAAALRTAQENLAAARSKLDADAAPELLASDLRAVLASYGQIIGRVDHERVLDELFASFCIGK